MSRNWSIEEQVYVQPDVKLRFEFTSQHTEQVARGEEPPLHDKWIMLNVYNESNTRVIRMNFSRAGQVISSTVDELGVGEDVPLTEHEKAAAARDPRNQDPPTASDGGLNADFARVLHEAKPLDEGTVTDQTGAWAGINLAERFSGDI